MTTAKDLMTENPSAVRDSAKVSEAVALFRDLDVRHLPVINASRELVGMLSDRDLRSLALPHVIDSEWIGTIQTALEARVSTVMSSNAIAVTVDAEAREIIELMLEHKIGAVPVVDADGVLAGIVSYVDLLHVLADIEDAASAAQ
jgi:acetoin utilization protein AcuB